MLSRLSEVAADRAGDSALVFIDHGGNAVGKSWRDFHSEVRSAAGRFQDATPPGTVIACPARNSIESVVRIAAVLGSGRTLLPLDPQSPVSGPASVVDRVRGEGGAVELADELLETGHGWDRGSATSPFASGGHVLSTGGSTGRPKLIHTEGAPSYDPRAVPSALLRRTRWRRYQTQLLPGPLHHAASFARLVDGLLSGNTFVIPQVFSADAIVDAIERHAVEWAQLTPTHMRILNDLLSDRPSAFRSLRAVLHTTAPCPADVKRNWIEHLGGARVFEMYTSTEGIGATLCDGHEWLAKPGTVGRGFYTRIRIRGEDGALAPSGTVGDVYMRSIIKGRPHIESGGDLLEGYDSVGDRGYLDRDGYLFLTGRNDNMLLIGGENVYGTEVEAVILSCPGVADAAIVDLPDDLLGSRLRALVASRPAGSLKSSDILDHCLRHLAPNKVPSEVRFVDSLPRTPAGKLDRKRLRSLHGQSSG